MSNKKLFYFGSIGGPGHYLFPSLRDIVKDEMPGTNFKIINNIDGLFAPENNTAQGAASFTQAGPLSIIAWHDYTVDDRGGSNSNIIGYGYYGDQKNIIDAMFEDFKLQFPQVSQRQTTPINIEGYGTIQINNNNGK